MSNPYPVEIADPGDGVVKTAGNLTFTDPANQPGGGSQPQRNVGQVELDFNDLAVSGTSVPIPFVFGDGDAAMLDLTTPTTPLPVEAGIYAYTLVVHQLGGGSSGAFTVTLTVDDDYYSISATETGGGLEAVALAVTWFSTAGSACHAAVASAVSDTFSGNLYVQKIA